MEIKLTADWIIMHNSEVFISEDGKGCFRIFDDSFQHHLIELALKTINVRYECEEHYEEDDEDYEKPSYYYTFDNIEDIKDNCPELYAEFQKLLKQRIEWVEELKQKQNIILNFSATPKTLTQVISHVDKVFYKEEDRYGTHKNFIKGHVKYLVDDLLESDLIIKIKNKYQANGITSI